MGRTRTGPIHGGFGHIAHLIERGREIYELVYDPNIVYEPIKEARHGRRE